MRQLQNTLWAISIGFIPNYILIHYDISVGDFRCCFGQDFMSHSQAHTESVNRDLMIQVLSHLLSVSSHAVGSKHIGLFLTCSSQVTLQLWPHVPQTKTLSGFSSDPSLPATHLLPAHEWTSELCFLVCKIMNVGKIAQVCSEPLSGFLRAKFCPQELCVRVSYWGTCVGSVCSQVCSAKHYWHHKSTFATYLWAILAVSGISVVKRSDCCSTTYPLLLERSAFSFTVAAFAQRSRTDTSLCQRRVSSCWR